MRKTPRFDFFMCETYDRKQLIKILKDQNLLGKDYIAFSNFNDIKEKYPELLI